MWEFFGGGLGFLDSVIYTHEERRQDELMKGQIDATNAQTDAMNLQTLVLASKQSPAIPVAIIAGGVAVAGLAIWALK